MGKQDHSYFCSYLSKADGWTVFLPCSAKGALISESFSLWLKSPKECAKSLSWMIIFSLLSRWIVLWVVIRNLFLEIWSKVKKNYSEIKPPLASLQEAASEQSQIWRALFIFSCRHFLPDVNWRAVGRLRRAVLRCATTAWVSELNKSEHVSIHLMALVDRVTPPVEPKRPVHIPVVQFSPASALVLGLCEGCKTEWVRSESVTVKE